METPTLRRKPDRRARRRTPPHDMARTTPEDGDIVVREEQRDGTLVYVLHTAPGPDQYLLRSRRDAVTHALTFALRAHARAWLTGAQADFGLLLEDFRAVTPIGDVLSRLRAEFVEMPGLRLTPEQVQRLCGVEAALCQRVLQGLVDAKFLCVTPDGHYARLVDDTIQRPQPAKRDRRTDTRFVKAS